MDPTKDLSTLVTNFSTLTQKQKVFVGVQSAIGIFVVIFLIILVFSPATYNLNDAGIWMSRLALGGIALSFVMNKLNV